jgi:hypothetical protein
MDGQSVYASVRHRSSPLRRSEIVERNRRFSSFSLLPTTAMQRLFRAARPTVFKTARQPSSKLPAARRSFFWSGSSSSASSSVDLAATSIPHASQDVLPFLFGVLLANAGSGDEADDEKLHSPPWKVVSMSG